MHDGFTTITGIYDEEGKCLWIDEAQAHTGPGDSGGPCFLESDGIAYQVSVTSWGNCVAPVTPHVPWILDTLYPSTALYRQGVTSMPGSAREVAVGMSLDDFWILGTYSPNAGGREVYHWTQRPIEEARWEMVPGGAVSIDMDSDGWPFVINDQGDFWKWGGRGWTQGAELNMVDKPVRSFSTTIENTNQRWLISSTGDVQHADGQQWILVPSPSNASAIAQRRFSDEQDWERARSELWLLAGSTTDKDIYVWEPWQRNTLHTALDIGVGANGAVWKIDYWNQIHQRGTNGWVIQSGTAKAIDVGPNGSPWIVDTSDRIAHLTNSGWQTWDQPRATDITAGPDGAVWVISKDDLDYRGNGLLFKLDSSTNQFLPYVTEDVSHARKLDAGPSGKLCCITTASNGANVVACRENGTWTRIQHANTWDLAALAISVSSDGSVWAVRDDGGGRDVMRWTSSTRDWLLQWEKADTIDANGTEVWAGAGASGRVFLSRFAGSGHWRQIPGTARDIRGESHRLVIVGTSGDATAGWDLYEWNSGASSWSSLNKRGKRIDISGDGTIWTITGADNHVEYRNPDTEIWTSVPNIPGGATDLGVGADNVPWIVGSTITGGGKQIYRLNRHGWTKPSADAAGKRLDVGADGNPWIVNNGDQVFRWDPAASSFMLTGSARDIGIGYNQPWAVGTNGSPGGYQLYAWNLWTSAWVERDGAALTLDVDAENRVYVANDQNQLLRRSGANAWTNLAAPVPVSEVGVGADKSAYYLGGAIRDGQHVRMDNTVPLTRISGGPLGSVVGVSSTDQIVFR